MGRGIAVPDGEHRALATERGFTKHLVLMIAEDLASCKPEGIRFSGPSAFGWTSVHRHRTGAGALSDSKTVRP